MHLVKIFLFALVYFPGLADAQTTRQMIERYPQRDTLVVNEGKAILYAGPNKGSEELSKVVIGTYVFNVRDSKEFYLVFTLDDRYGFIEKTSVTKFSKTSHVKPYVPATAAPDRSHLAFVDSTGVQLVENRSQVSAKELAAIRKDVADIKLIMIIWSVVSLVGIGVSISAVN